MRRELTFVKLAIALLGVVSVLGLALAMCTPPPTP